MKKFTQDEKAPKSGNDVPVQKDHAENIPKHEHKADDAKLVSNVPSLVEKIGNSHSKESVISISSHAKSAKK